MTSASIFKNNKLGICPNCGCTELSVEELPNYAGSPRDGAPVYCPRCDADGCVMCEIDQDSNEIRWVNWYMPECGGGYSTGITADDDSSEIEL